MASEKKNIRTSSCRQYIVWLQRRKTSELPLAGNTLYGFGEEKHQNFLLQAIHCMASEKKNCDSDEARQYIVWLQRRKTSELPLAGNTLYGSEEENCETD